MTRQLVFGEVEYGIPHGVTGRYLELSSFKARGGVCAVSYCHWRDNNRTFSAPAMWSAGATSLMFAHTLDDGDEFERSILDQIARGQLYWSYGDGGYPGATRSAIVAHGGRSIAYAIQPLALVAFDHVAYVPLPAFAQLPIKWVGLN